MIVIIKYYKWFLFICLNKPDAIFFTTLDKYIVI